MKTKDLYLLLMLLFAVVPCAEAQDYLYATGQPAYSTSLPIDQGSVNVNNGEIHLEIPLATYKQRGQLTLDEKLVYDSRIWKILQNGSSYSWQPTNVPNANGGWRFSNGVGNGVVSYSSYGGTDSNAPDCPGSADAETYTQYFEWYWTDLNGTAHAFPSASTVKYNPGDPHCTGTAPEGNATSGGFASDGSGYTLTLTNYTTAVITSRDGTTYYPSSGGNTTDRNGNYFSVDANGNLVGTNGTAPILATTSGNQTVYSVIGVGGVRNKYTVTTTTVYFNTSFAETSVKDASGSFTAIQSIALPDGSSYQFAYDSGTSAGHYGELTSMTLPTGGVVTYGWSNYVDSFNNSNRWLTSLARDGGTTLFTPALISKCSGSAGCQESVSVQTPDNNTTVYTFNLDKAGLTAGSSWVQGIRSYQGSPSSGTLLRSSTTSYTYTTYSFEADENGTFYIVGTYQVPASIVTTVTLNDVGLSSQTTTTLDGSGGLPTDVKVWDFGASTSGTPTRETLTGYMAWGEPASIVLKDLSGNQVSKVTYGYDESTPSAAPSGLSNYTSSVRSSGNQTSMHQWINTSNTTLDSTMTYDSTGAALTSTRPEGTTKYAYDSTDTFITSVTAPTPSSGVALATGATYDASTGMVLSTTDFNNQTTTYKNYDDLNRVREIDYPDGGKKAFNYPNDNTDYAQTYLNASTSGFTYHDTDAYGRADRISIFNGQSSNQWYQQDSCFDTSGRLHFQTYSYQGTGLNGAKVCSGSGDTTTYDAFGRVLTVTHADNSVVSYSYRGRATKLVDENGVTRITQVDGLGRITSVCEVSAVTLQVGSTTDKAPVACGQDITATGFLTSYSYTTDSSKDQVTTITQGAQTRTTVTDSLGRTVSVTEPERGATTYSYAYSTTAGLGLKVTRERPMANQSNVGILTTTTTQYDSLGRMVTVNYDDNLSGPKAYYYDTNCCWPQVNPSNMKGNLVVTGAGALSSNHVGSVFSYDAMGRIIGKWSCEPDTCPTSYMASRPLSFSYDWAGNLTSQSDPATGTIAYGRSPAGEITSITNNTYTLSGASGTATLLSNATNGPDGPISYNYGNGLSQYDNYDSLGRINGGWVCIGAPSAACPNQRNGFVVSWSGTRAVSSGENYVGQSITYQYDDFNRLTGMKDSAGTATYNYVYDRYGNRWQQNALQGGSSFSQTFNAVTSNNRISSGGYQYDAAGNMTNDTLHTYTYDAEGKVLQVDGGSTFSYVYDAFGNAVSDSVEGQQVDGLFDMQGRVTSIWSSPTTSGESHIFADNTQVAFRSGDGHTYFVHKNWLNTDRVHTDLNGATGAIFTSLPYGDGGAATVNQIYAGWDFDQFGDMDDNWTDNTYFAKFRTYSPAQARWMSPDPYDGSYDPSNPQSFNRYAYVGNNPLSFIDPLGLQCTGTSATYDGQSYGGTIACSTGWLNTLFSDIGHLFGFGRPSFKGVVGSPRPPSGKVPCSSVPAAPPGEDYSHNMALQNGMSFDSWLLNELPQGDWDWKDLVDRSWNPSGKSFAAAGNFNYGATCFARGYSLTTCQSGAGVAAYFSAGISFIPNLLHGINPFTMGPGIPFVYGADGNGTPTYGDQTAPTENPTVIAGWNYGASGGCQP